MNLRGIEGAATGAARHLKGGSLAGRRQGARGKRYVGGGSRWSMRERPHFRFEDLEIWQRARDLAVGFYQVAIVLEAKKLYRYAEQLRAAGLSIPNNIAEGSASPHAAEFKQFLNIARRSLFENASMLLTFERMGIFDSQTITPLLGDCDTLSRMITAFTRTR